MLSPLRGKDPVYVLLVGTLGTYGYRGGRPQTACERRSAVLGRVLQQFRWAPELVQGRWRHQQTRVLRLHRRKTKRCILALYPQLTQPPAYPKAYDHHAAFKCPRNVSHIANNDSLTPALLSGSRTRKCKVEMESSWRLCGGKRRQLNTIVPQHAGIWVGVPPRYHSWGSG